jgi:cell division protein FtsL
VSASAASTRARTRTRNRRPPVRATRRRSRKLIVRKGTRRIAPLTIAGAMVVLAVVFTVLLEQVVLAQSAFKLASLREELFEAEETRQELRLEAERLANSDRIERIARDELGMIDPDPTVANFVYADIVDRSESPRRLELADTGSPGAGSAAPESP